MIMNVRIIDNIVLYPPPPKKNSNSSSGIRINTWGIPREIISGAGVTLTFTLEFTLTAVYQYIQQCIYLSMYQYKQYEMTFFFPCQNF